jgi:kinesin family member 13
MGDGSVKVAIRVRPFNNREKAEGAVLCIQMQGKMTKVFSPELTKEFFFDYSYWSHDGFVEDPESGMMVKDSPSSIYSDQKTVYNDLGVGVLNNAFEGYHCCLFAYGQTGSGKSYSMVGYGKNKGIIPIVCEEIFKRIETVESNTLHCEVQASMLEIYNEQVQDLLKPPAERVKGGLKIREDPKTGVYVEGLSKSPCSSYEEISAILDKGNNNRTVAATQMNATSSRAHTVLTISFTQIMYDDTGKPLNRKQSNINLVDLAGSERASKTGASGDTLKEGSNINKSLSTLGRVITTLAKKSSGSKEVVPYRESSLTRILQNALGGNSKTTMIAAISPATFNIEETISTLRYADQVKSIKNQAVVNETPQEKLIRELKEENEKLKAMLEGKSFSGGGGSGINDELRQQYERQIEELKRAKEEAERTFQDRPKEAPRTHALVNDTSKLNLNTPHLSNLNEDPLLSGYITQVIKPGKNRIGKKNPNDPPDIIIEGLGIGVDHCVIEYANDQCTIYPSSDPNLKTMINGKILAEPTVLENQNRIRFGNHNFFLYIDPEELSSATYDWEYAVKEANEEQVRGLLGKQDEELKAKEEELKKKIEAEYELARKKMEEEKKQLEGLMKSKNKNDLATQKALAEREQELLARQKAMEEEMRKKELMLKQHEDNRIALEKLKKLLSHAIQQINEANERAVLLGKNVTYQPELYREGGGLGKGLQSTNVRVKVIYPDISEDFQIHWGLDKLEGRLVDMQEICNQLDFGGDPNDIIMDYDPFSDNIDNFTHTYHLIGQAYCYMDTLYYLTSLEEDSMAIIDDHGANKGALKVSLIPEIQGVKLEEFESLKDLLGKELTFTIKIFEAAGIPENFCTKVFCKYTLVNLNNEEFKTLPVEETTTNPKFNYVKSHKIIITPEAADEYLNRALTISVFGDLSESTKERELKKLKENVNSSLSKSITSKRLTKVKDSGLSIISVEKDSETANVLPSILQVDNSSIDQLKYELDIKEQQLQRIKAEQLKKEMEYSRKIKELEEREKKLGIEKPVPNRKSACCITF